MLIFCDFIQVCVFTTNYNLKCQLYGYGIGRKTLKWIDYFLCDRQQRVVVNGVKSD